MSGVGCLRRLVMTRADALRRAAVRSYQLTALVAAEPPPRAHVYARRSIATAQAVYETALAHAALTRARVAYDAAVARRYAASLRD